MQINLLTSLFNQCKDFSAAKTKQKKSSDFLNLEKKTKSINSTSALFQLLPNISFKASSFEKKFQRAVNEILRIIENLKSDNSELNDETKKEIVELYKKTVNE